MAKQPSRTVIAAWANLMRAQRRALSHVEAALKNGGFPPLAWYDALLELSRVRETGLRPFELQEKMLLPQYGLSRLLDRIEASGYLERRPCSEDGRGQVVFITDAGSDLLQSMWPVYGAAIDEAVGACLSEQQATSLNALLGELVGPREPAGR